MPRSSFDFDRGITQWRMEPLSGSARAGSWSFTLGYDGPVPRFEDVAYGDYFQTSQVINTTNVALIRCHVNITQPKNLPSIEDVSKDIQFIAESIDSPGNKVVIGRGLTAADINKSLVVTGCINAGNNTTFKLIGLADPLTGYVDQTITTEGPRSTISAIFKGARWKFSLLIDGTEYARCIQSDRETGFYRDDLTLHCSKLTGNHTISFRITLIEQNENNTYDFFEGPPRDGLVFWVRGDTGLTSGGGIATAWADQSGYNQHLTVDSTFEPSVGLDTIDGVPCVTFPSNGAKYFLRNAAIKDRNGVNIGYGGGETQSRTIMAVILPKTEVFSITGGPVFLMAGSILPDFICLFDLESTFASNAFYLASETWRNLAGGNRGPDTPGSTYNNVPVLGEWKSTGFPNVSVAVNGVTQTLTPSTLPGSFGASTAPFTILGNVDLVGFGLNFQGAIAEVLVWDHVLTGSETTKARAYIATKYPSIGL